MKIKDFLNENKYNNYEIYGFFDIVLRFMYQKEIDGYDILLDLEIEEVFDR
jgi:hypothetical protein